MRGKNRREEIEKGQERMRERGKRDVEREVEEKEMGREE